MEKIMVGKNMIKYCFSVNIITFLLLIVSINSDVLAQADSAKQINVPDLPIRESFETNKQLITPWANIICQISDKEVNPPNCPDKKTPQIWTAASSVTLYNGDGSVWFDFSLDNNNPRHFLKNKVDFLPFSTDFGDEGFTLRLVAESPNWYQVEVNEATQATKYILKSDPLWMKVTWSYFLAKVRILSFDGDNKTQLFDKPNGKAIEESSDILWSDVRFRLKTEGDWAFVEGYLPSKVYQGWVRWRKGREMLFESKFFKDKFNKQTIEE